MIIYVDLLYVLLLLLFLCLMGNLGNIKNLLQCDIWFLVIVLILTRSSADTEEPREHTVS